MGNNMVDITAVRKKRKRMKRVRQGMIAVLVLVLVIVALLVNEIMVQQNITGQVSGMIHSIGGDGYPVKVPSGTIEMVNHVNDNLIVMTSTNLYSYTPNGKEISISQGFYERTNILTSGDRMLSYDNGGNAVVIYSNNSIVQRRELNESIVTAAIGKSGDYAIVTDPRNHVSKVQLFLSGQSLTEEGVFTWSSPDYLIYRVAISPKGDRLAVVYLTTDDGIMQSVFQIFDVKTGELILSDYKIPNDLVISMEFQNDNQLQLLTDHQYLVVDSSGSKIGGYAIPADNNLRAFRTNNSNVLLWYVDASKTNQIVCLSKEGNLLGVYNSPNYVVDLAILSDRVFVYTDGVLEEFNLSMQLQNSSSLAGISQIYALNNNLYLFSRTDISLLWNKEDNT